MRFNLILTNTNLYRAKYETFIMLTFALTKNRNIISLTI